jgi:hypothetical protein
MFKGVELRGEWVKYNKELSDFYIKLIYVFLRVEVRVEFVKYVLRGIEFSI